jgi:hypothetical protein
MRAGIDGFVVDMANEPYWYKVIAAMFKVVHEKKYAFEICACLDNVPDRAGQLTWFLDTYRDSPNGWTNYRTKFPGVSFSRSVLGFMYSRGRYGIDFFCSALVLQPSRRRADGVDLAKEANERGSRACGRADAGGVTLSDCLNSRYFPKRLLRTARAHSMVGEATQRRRRRSSAPAPSASRLRLAGSGTAGPVTSA